MEVSPDEQDKYVFPELAKTLRIMERVREGIVQARTPTAIEFSFAGNLRYKHLGEANTGEWFADKFEGGRRLLGGHSDFGGLARVRSYWFDDLAGAFSFRPLVVFFSKT